MRSLKLGVLLAIFALSAIGAANASAAPKFTASAIGGLTGKALGNQVFTTGEGKTITCTTAVTSGNIVATVSTEQHVTVRYNNCTGPLGVTVDVSEATYLFTANGEVHLKNTVTQTVTAGLLECTITIKPQTLSGITYENNGSRLKVNANVKNIAFTSTGGACGASGTTATYTGENEVEREGGGTISWDKE